MCSGMQMDWAYSQVNLVGISRDMHCSKTRKKKDGGKTLWITENECGRHETSTAQLERAIIKSP